MFQWWRRRHIGPGYIEPLTSNLGSRCSWVVSHTPLSIFPWGKVPLYLLKGGRVDSKAGVGSGEEINLMPLPGIELRFTSRQAHSLAIIPTEQSRLLYLSHFLLFSSLTGLTAEAADDISVSPHWINASHFSKSCNTCSWRL